MKNMKNKQKGISLPITLLILISLLLSMSVLIRSTDISMVISGNIGIHNQLYGSNNKTVSDAITWLNTNSNTLDNDNSAFGYFSAQPNNEIDYNNSANWVNSYPALPTQDSYQNIGQYKILRMCSLANTPFNGSSNGIQNVCSTGTVGGNTSGSTSNGYDIYNFGSTSITAVYYKIITRTCFKSCESFQKNALMITETIVKL